MNCDINSEINRIINSEHHDPFQVLGFHVLDQDAASSVIRTFQPNATACWLITNGEKKEMY
ncbi:MAG TPA: hypothetical protein VGA28_08955, partial [Desulfurivibrionaceae bacterium]